MIAERMEQFDLGIRQFDEHHRDAMRGLGLRRRHLCAERVAVERGRTLKIGDSDGDVIETADHFQTSTTRTFTCGRLPQT